MKWILNTARIIVGILFIFSGLIKANDPLGLSYKMQEFFDVWGWSFLDSYTLALSLAMIAFEILAGVAVLLGWRMRLFSWLLLVLIVFFSFLTGYAYLTGKVRECGCFGDCIPLQAGQSFVKDLILLALILFLFFSWRKIKPLLRPLASSVILFFVLVFSFALQWYVLQHLPLIDCLPYRAGAHILEKMKIPAGAVPDSTVISFVYRKDGHEIEFTADQFPADFNDSTYTFVRRYDKLVRKGNAEPAIKDFKLTDSAGNDLTSDLLQQPGTKLFLFIKDGIPGGDWAGYFDAIRKQAEKEQIPFFLVTNLPLETIRRSPIAGLRTLIPLRCDVTAIKTAARANPTLYLLRGDEIMQKWGYADFNKAILSIR